jgi:hypothetical protein
MKKPVLPQVTLCAVDARGPALALQALQRSMAQIDFARVVLFTHRWQPPAPLPGVEVLDIGPIASSAAYSHFVLRKLPGHVLTPFVLITQWDGFVIDAAAWTDAFLDCDYIGAVWPEQAAECSVGNGGFSLRSQRLLQAGLDPRIEREHPEDVMLCRDYRALLSSQHGVRFAAPALARRFAFENESPSGPTLGFHGPYNLPKVLDEATLAAWLEVLPSEFFGGRDARRLARALLAQRMPRTAQRLLQRRRAAGRNDINTRSLGAVAAVMQRLVGLRE